MYVKRRYWQTKKNVYRLFNASLCLTTKYQYKIQIDVHLEPHTRLSSMPFHIVNKEQFLGGNQGVLFRLHILHRFDHITLCIVSLKLTWRCLMNGLMRPFCWSHHSTDFIHSQGASIAEPRACLAKDSKPCLCQDWSKLIITPQRKLHHSTALDKLVLDRQILQMTCSNHLPI